ncbi:hypothetical protein [Psychrobacter sp. CAL346-MNA-CIBAN-0220]
MKRISKHKERYYNNNKDFKLKSKPSNQQQGAEYLERNNKQIH